MDDFKLKNKLNKPVNHIPKIYDPLTENNTTQIEQFMILKQLSNTLPHFRNCKFLFSAFEN